MSEMENKSSELSEIVELRQQCADLRSQVNRLLMGLTVSSLILTAFFFIQMRRTVKDLGVVQTQAVQFSEANKKDEPLIKGFVGRLTEYARTHEDFRVALASQGINLTNNPGAAVPPAGPAAVPK
jgi:hypothetical protein